ncbi:GNAT family N-acetyltransferase [Erysipelothrix aquatica]|uniref:GNAT family N-acetyltransferase n=1 Tax=Erysipelothrix aquatica TaxID=2683714 RepID=UPI00135772E0|nr:GNAT family N-acetyltransferase [Erysipelothrix aquatica]
MTYQIRKATDTDREAIVEMYRNASAMLKKAGIDQWQDGYPNIETLTQDIDAGTSFVYVEDETVLASGMVSTMGESTYATIHGAWGYDAPYAVIHRFVVSSTHQRGGLGSQFLQAIETEIGIPYYRIDTHVQNRKMRSFLERNGYIERGEITLLNGSKRIAYDKLIVK